MAEKLSAGYSRRQVLVCLGAAYMSGGLLRPGPVTAAPACVVRPQQTEGPFYLDPALNRRDIRVDPEDGSVTPGLPLELGLRVGALTSAGCRPLPDTRIDIWQCDARGRYSGVRGAGLNTAGQSFLRGHQFTDAAGEAGFITIYPGWYPGRTVHIHFKIRTGPQSAPEHEFSSQLYFEDDLTDAVLDTSPYSSRRGRRVRNHQDGLFRRGGERLMLKPEKAGDGYRARFDIALQLS